MARSRELGVRQLLLCILCLFIGRSASGYGADSGALGEIAASVGGLLAINPRATKIITNGGWRQAGG